MITRELAQYYFKLLRESAPLPFINHVEQSDKGIACVLCYLSEHSGKVYANSIADDMNVSRARISIIVEKLVRRGLVRKINSNIDARIQELSITPKGRGLLREIDDNISQKIMAIVEVIGEDEFLHFISLCKKIKEVMYQKFLFDDCKKDINCKK